MIVRRNGCFLVVFAASLLIANASPGDSLCQDSAGTKTKVAGKVALKAYAFDLRDVRLLDGPFKRAMELDKAYLLSLDTNRLLHVFRLNAGVQTTARPLGGWEEPSIEVRGHFVGHYLSACAMMYASTGDERLRERGNAIVAGMAECQTALGASGYLSAFPEYYFTRLETAQTLPWAPYYVLHKIYAGLLDMYVYCDNRQALDVCKKAADWVIVRNSRLTDKQMRQVLGMEHGGINEVLADLFAITGEDKYLKIAQRFNHMAVLGPAASREDKLTGLHANTQIPKFVGAARQYELTGDESLKTAAAFFWDTVVHERSYVIGGNSNSEGFSAKERLSEALGPNTTETCNTYNMLKLTRRLFCWEPRVEFADYYERALYNHILASQNPADGMMCYYVPLRSGMTRGGSSSGYCSPLDSFWCCTGTGVENHAKYGDSIYFHDGDKSLYVNLFIASTLNWRAKGVKIRQETKYPDQSETRLTVACEKPTEMALVVRRPAWAVDGFTVRVNGQLQTITAPPGSYATVERTWSNGDTLDVSLPLSLRAEGFRDNPRRLAVFYGPLVLCAEVDRKLRFGDELSRPYPGIAANGVEWLSSLKPAAGRCCAFTGPSSVFHVSDDQGDAGVTLEPFYRVHGDRHYVVYWDQYRPEEWATLAGEHRREMARWVDSVFPGDDPSEQGHKLQGERTEIGEFMGIKWRHATNGGWFSWEMKVLADRPQQLRVRYLSNDAGREFDILVDGVAIASPKLKSTGPDQFYDEAYDIPTERTAGRSTVVVRFQARSGTIAGGVFGCRVILKD